MSQITIGVDVPASVDTSAFIADLQEWLRRYGARLVVWAPPDEEHGPPQDLEVEP